MNGLPLTLFAIVFAGSFLAGLLAFVLLGRRKPGGQIADFTLFEPPEPGKFRLVCVEMGGKGALRISAQQDFDSLDEAKTEAAAKMKSATAAGGPLVYFSVIDSGGKPVFLQEDPPAVT